MMVVGEYLLWNILEILVYALVVDLLWQDVQRGAILPPPAPSSHATLDLILQPHKEDFFGLYTLSFIRMV